MNDVDTLDQKLIGFAFAARGVVLHRDPGADGLPSYIYTPDENAWPEVNVVRMIFNWRLAQFAPGSRSFYTGRYWCYAGTGLGAYVRAVAALSAWRGDPDDEPVGWIKSWDGRRS